MFKKFFTLVLPLCLTALLLAGCGSSPAEEDSPAQDGDPDVLQIKTGLGPLATYLDLDGLSQETLDTCYEVLDLTQEDEGTGASLHITETMGDSTLLYAAFTLTCPHAEGDSLPALQASLIQGSGSESSAGPSVITGLRVEEADDGSFNCLAIFDYETEVLSAGEPLTLMVESGAEQAFTLAVTWTPQKLAQVHTVELRDNGGEPVGTALLSPLSLKLSLKETGGKSEEELSNSIALLDSQGEALPVNGAFMLNASPEVTGGGGFFAPVELSQVHTIQVGDYTGEFSL